MGFKPSKYAAKHIYIYIVFFTQKKNLDFHPHRGYYLLFFFSSRSRAKMSSSAQTSSQSLPTDKARLSLGIKLAVSSPRSAVVRTFESPSRKRSMKEMDKDVTKLFSLSLAKACQQQAFVQTTRYRVGLPNLSMTTGRRLPYAR